MYVDGITELPYIVLIPAPRFFIRRAAARLIVSQPARLTTSSSARPATHVTTLRPIFDRQFSQSRPWLADEEPVKKVAVGGEATPAQAETSGETVPPAASGSAPASEEVNEAAPQVLDAQTRTGGYDETAAGHAAGDASGRTAPVNDDNGPALNTSSYDANAMPSSAPEGKSAQSSEPTTFDKAAGLASAAAETASSTAASAASAARQTYDQVATSQQTPLAPFSSRRPASRTPPEPTKILYVGNLFFEVTAPQLEREFSRFGTITNSRVVTDHKGLSKGFGYIEFEKLEDAETAVRELDQKVFEGRRMAVQFHVKRERMDRQGQRSGLGGLGRGGRERAGQAEPSKTLFIGNMSYQMSDKDLNGTLTPRRI